MESSGANPYALSPIERHEPIDCFMLIDERDPENIKRSVLIPGPVRLYDKKKDPDIYDLIITGEGSDGFSWNKARPKVFDQLQNGEQVEGLEPLTIIPIQIGREFVASAQASWSMGGMMSRISQYYTTLLNDGHKLQE